MVLAGALHMLYLHGCWFLLFSQYVGWCSDFIYLFVFYWMMLSGPLYICSIVGEWMVWNNQLTRLWSLTFCGGREENYGNMKDGVCPIQCVNWALTKYLVRLVKNSLAQAVPFRNVSQKWYCLGQPAWC